MDPRGLDGKDQFIVYSGDFIFHIYSKYVYIYIIIIIIYFIIKIINILMCLYFCLCNFFFTHNKPNLYFLHNYI